MLNMQNVKDIEITEGDVRTIYNKDNRLIWGRLAYDTKYAGDTYQQTYSGKNLLEGTPWQTVVTSSGYPSHIGTGITINSSDNNNIDFTSTENYRGVESNYIQIANGTTITVSFTGTLPNRLYVTQYDSNKTRVSTLNPSVTTVGIITVTTTQDGYITVAFANSTSGSFTISNVQMEVGSSATSYEPYVGGIPAPNPDYPQRIQMVTGEQTVTISDGVESQSYPISLGSIELCKLGNYQDYIYNSGDDWYVHKAIGKILLKDVASNFEYGRRNDSYSINKTNYLSQFNLPNSTTNYYVTTFNPSGGAPSKIGLSGVGTYVNFNYNNTSTSDGLVTFRNWLTTSLTTMYATLATPTDTQIADATLVGQLNAVHEWLTRYGYTSTVTGNLPIIINQTNL